MYRLAHALYLHDSFQSAPAMAFHLFLSLLPLLVFLGYVVGLFAQSTSVEQVMWPLVDVLPKDTAVIVKQEIEHMAGASRLGPLSFLGFLWLAAGGAHGLMDSLEVVVGAPRRLWWQKRLIAFGCVIVAMVGLTALSFGVIRWDTLGHGHQLVRSGSWVTLVLVFAVLVLVLSAFYWFAVGHRSTVKRRLVPGATLAVFLGGLATWAFGIYVSSLATYTVFYGGLAAVAVLLLWLWLICLALLIGAELNAQLEGLRDFELESTPPPLYDDA